MEIVSQPPTCMLLGLNVILFWTGLAVLLTKRNIIFSIIGIELMIQAAISNFIVFDGCHREQGQVFAIFVTIGSTCEVVVLLALSLWLFYKTGSTDINKV